MIGAVTHTMKWTIEEMGLESFAPGDVIIHNDSYGADAICRSTW